MRNPPTRSTSWAASARRVREAAFSESGPPAIPMSGRCRSPRATTRGRARRNATTSGWYGASRSSRRTATAFPAIIMLRQAATSASSNNASAHHAALQKRRAVSARDVARFRGVLILLVLDRGRRRQPGQVPRDDDGIEVLVSGFRQPVPSLVAPEQGDAEIAANRQRLAVRA